MSSVASSILYSSTRRDSGPVLFISYASFRSMVWEVSLRWLKYVPLERSPRSSRHITTSGQSRLASFSFSAAVDLRGTFGDSRAEPNPKRAKASHHRLVLKGHVVDPFIHPLLIFSIIISPHSTSPLVPLSDMLIILPVAGAFLTHNALASVVGSRGRSMPQIILSNHDGAAAALPPPDTLEDVDISEGWADPRINGGRFLDVRLSHIPCRHA